MTRQAVTKPDLTPRFIDDLRTITSKEPDALTPSDIEFLASRSAYLTEEEAKTYKGVLADLAESRKLRADRIAQVRANQKKAAPKKGKK